MSPLDQVKLRELMELSTGRPEVVIALLDGTVALNHPAFKGRSIRQISSKLNEASDECNQVDNTACLHGTFMAGILCAARGSPAPAICPDCTLLIRPIFTKAVSSDDQIPSTAPEELAAAISESVDAGARVINMSVALTQLSSTGGKDLREALDYAVKKGSVVVAAAGNQGKVGSSILIHHPWVIPVVACDAQGKPTGYSNLGNSIGRHGLRAPGEQIISLNAAGGSITMGGTSVSAPFVTGTVALLLSEFPSARGAEVKAAISQIYSGRRTTIVPPLLNAWKAYEVMARNNL